MSPVALTGLARIPRLLLKYGQDHGIDQADLMQTAGISENDIRDPDSRIPLIKTWNLWRVLIDRTSDPMLGLHVGRSVKLRDVGLVGYAAFYSRTLRDALNRLARYSRIFSEATQFDLKHDHQRGWITFDNGPRFVELRHPVDGALALIVSAIRDLTHTSVTPVEVRLPYPRPADPYELERFVRAPVQYDSSKGRVVLERKVLDLPVVSSDETLTKYLETLADDVLSQLAARSSFVDDVRRTVWAELTSGPPTLKDTATLLGVSVRTLQRRLSDEGTSYAEVLETIRREMALKLLRDKSLAVYEVAFLLGYSEPSTFYRAFRRWQQTSPHEYRRSIA